MNHEGVTATNNVNPRQDSLSFTLWLSGELPMPRAGMEVVWQRWNTATNSEVEREYGGVITNVSERDEGGALAYEVSAQPYNRWFDRRLVKGFTQQQRAEDTIKQIVSQYCPGFTTEYVNAKPIIVSQYFNYQRPSKVMQIICDQIAHAWYIDHYRRLHVFRKEDFKSPLPNNLLDVDNDFVNYGDLALSEDSEEVYNRITMRGFKVRSNDTYTFYYRGDGTTNQWTLGYRISSAKGDVKVTVNGVDYPVKRDVLEGVPGQGGDPNVAYIHYTQHLVRFAVPPAAGALIAVTAVPLRDRVYTNQDNVSVAYMRDIESNVASDGIYEYAELNKSFSQSTMDAVTSSVEALLKKHGTPIISGTFTSFTPGWRAGQTFRLFSNRRFGGLFNVNNIRTMYVFRVTKRWVQPAHPNGSSPWHTTPIQYTIEFADRPNLV